MSIKHLNQAQLAARWGVSQATLERWRSKGIGPVFLKLPGRVIYRIEDIESYEAEHLHKSTYERVGTQRPVAGKDTDVAFEDVK